MTGSLAELPYHPHIQHVDPANTYWYLSAAPELLALAAARLETTIGGELMTALAPTLQAFFTDRLIAQRRASPHTIASYRDTMRLLLHSRNSRPAPRRPSSTSADLDATVDRRVPGPPRARPRQQRSAPGTRGWRRSAPSSRYAALRHPEHAALIARVLAIPPKRHDRTTHHLTSPTRDRRAARRPRPLHLDRTPRPRDAHTRRPRPACASPNSPASPSPTCTSAPARTSTAIGKGRKRRITPLTKPHRRRAPAWLTERAGQPADPLFPTSTGRPLTRDAVERRLAMHAAAAAHAARRCTPRTSRRTCCATPPRCGSCTPASTPP